MKKYDIHISLSFVVLMAFFILLDENNLMFWTVFAMLLHELGHLAAIEAFNVKVSQIRVCALGAEIRICQTSRVSYFKEAVIRAAGPAAGILAALIFSPLGYLSGREAFFTAAGINLVFSAVNLIPVRTADGGMAVYYICCRFFGLYAAETALKICTAVFGTLLIILGTAVFVWTGSNISLLVFGLFLVFGEVCAKGRYNACV